MKISTNEYLQAIAKGCRLLKEQRFDLIIGISRGGLIPAVYISHFFNVPLAVIEYIGYDEQNKKIKSYILDVGKIAGKVSAKRCLLVDDIVDTGGTMQIAFKELNRFRPASLNCFSLYVRAGKKRPWPSFYVQEVPKEWIVFPYEASDFTLNEAMLQKCIKDTLRFDKKFGTDVTNNPTVSNLMYNALGLVGEAGEVANITKKIVRDGVTTKKLNRIAEELVDTVVYLCKLILVLNVNFEKAWDKKIDKLYKRWYENRSIAEGIRKRVNVNDKLKLEKEE